MAKIAGAIGNVCRKRRAFDSQGFGFITRGLKKYLKYELLRVLPSPAG